MSGSVGESKGGHVGRLGPQALAQSRTTPNNTRDKGINKMGVQRAPGGGDAPAALLPPPPLKFLKIAASKKSSSESQWSLLCAPTRASQFPLCRATDSCLQWSCGRIDDRNEKSRVLVLGDCVRGVSCFGVGAEQAIRRNLRLRKEYLYMKSLEGKEKEMYERKQKIKAALAGRGACRGLCTRAWRRPRGLAWARPRPCGRLVLWSVLSVPAAPVPNLPTPPSLLPFPVTHAHGQRARQSPQSCEPKRTRFGRRLSWTTPRLGNSRCGLAPVPLCGETLGSCVGQLVRNGLEERWEACS